MPANLVPGRTFEWLIRWVAEKYGVADQNSAVSGIPTDAHNLDKVKRAVNDGYREFIGLDPEWTFRNRTFTIATNSAGTGPENVGNSAAIYRLPRWVQRKPRGEFQYLDVSSQYPIIIPVDLKTIRARRQVNAISGPPQYCCVQPTDPADGFAGEGTTFTVIFWPAPDATYELESTAYAVPYDMVELGERHIAGAEHDLTIAAYGLKHMCMDPATESGRLAAARDICAEMLAISRAADAPARVGRRGVSRDGHWDLRYQDERQTPETGDSETYFRYEGAPVP